MIADSNKTKWGLSIYSPFYLHTWDQQGFYDSKISTSICKLQQLSKPTKLVTRYTLTQSLSIQLFQKLLVQTMCMTKIRLQKISIVLVDDELRSL